MKRKFAFKKQEMVLPAQTVLLDIQEQEGVNGGSRKDPKQAGWFQKLLDFVTGGSI
ncbi:hypothetical protein SAMN05421747_102218 [Parapedobacter composti]|uniref:Uncharacterized protein n=1 Tax=Parapedobacter composti TaxID=623281 RepID=A0A1I1F3J7_9SPHI|nr:hypothetical protein [Parapedobacter composti]SFB93841.1 hypothetical protein SAMN05421747_102218 [Parapedobacter composti]